MLGLAECKGEKLPDLAQGESRRGGRAPFIKRVCPNLAIGLPFLSSLSRTTDLALEAKHQGKEGRGER